VTSTRNSTADGRDVRALSSDDFKTVFDNAADGLFIHPLDSDEILAVNDRLTELLGYSREELLGMRVSEITADGWDPPVAAADRIEEAREAGQVRFEWRDQRKDGTTLPVEVTLTVVELDAGERVLASVHGIEERKRQERRARAIFDQTYQFTGLMEPDGTILEANETALEFGGIDREDVIGKPIWEAYWFAYSDAIQQQGRAAVQRAAEGEFVRRNLEVRGAEGTEVIDFSIRPVTDDRGEVTLLIPEGRVITELVEHRERLAAYNRIMRHNLRNQLTSINGYATKIRELADDPRVGQFGEQVLRASTRLERIGEQIRELDQLRERAAPGERIDIAALLDDIAAEHAGGGAADDEPTPHVAVPDGTTVRNDRHLLRLVVDQLVENAIEHGAPPIRLTATPTTRGEERGVEIRVCDDGNGIPTREYEPVLDGRSDPVEHTTSIGLLVAKWAADDLGGTLAFDTGDGTTATVWLPDEG
jgi:PAS domain S-box-containing protein